MPDPQESLSCIFLDTPWLYWEFKVEKEACESARLINDMPMFKNELDP